MPKKIDRHPSLWPRMKVRGKRRRRLAELRLTRVVYVPHALIEIDTRGRVVARSVPPNTPGTVKVKVTSIYDGLGRQVRFVSAEGLGVMRRGRSSF